MSPIERPLDSPSSRRRPLRVSSALLVILILVLGSALSLEQRGEVRLREELAAYKHRSEGEISSAISGWLPVDLVWPEGTPLEVVIDQIKSASRNPAFPKERADHHFPYLSEHGLRRRTEFLPFPGPRHVGSPAPCPKTGNGMNSVLRNPDHACLSGSSSRPNPKS